MQNIHVKRYETPTVWAGSIEPEDRSWIVFVAVDGEATFWRQATINQVGSGQIEHGYVNVEVSTGVGQQVGSPD